MGLAIGWDTPDGAPTMTTYLLVAFVSLLAAVTVLLTVRWHDRRRLLAERVPYAQRVRRAQETTDLNRQMLDEQAEQIAELRGEVARDTRITCEIRHHLTGADVNSQPFLKVVEDR